MAPKRKTTYLIEVRKNKDGRFYVKLTLDDSFDGCIDIKHWYEGEKVRVQVKEHNNRSDSKRIVPIMWYFSRNLPNNRILYRKCKKLYTRAFTIQ